MKRACLLNEGVVAAILARKYQGSAPTVEFVVLRAETPMGPIAMSAIASFETVDSISGRVRIEKYGAWQLIGPVTSCQKVMPDQLDHALLLTGYSIFLAYPTDDYSIYLIGDAERIQTVPEDDLKILWEFMKTLPKHYL
ncbi:MAG: hypothetical protein WCW17_00110 [Patescibacteria group bacterium]